MRIRNEHINVITDLRGIVAPETVRDLINHFKNGIPFALVFSNERYYVFFPLSLKAVAWDKTEFIYNSMENMFDSVKLKLISFPNFVSCANMIPQKKHKEIELKKPIVIKLLK